MISPPQLASPPWADQKKEPMAVAPKTHDLSCFDLSDMIECGRYVRGAGEEASSMEAAAGRVVEYFYRQMASAGGERNCALVRCFKTHRLSELPEDIIQAAQLPASDPHPETPCLTLLATAGDAPEWNDRRGSSGHAAIPLKSVQMVERAPMIAALLRQMGIGIEAALHPDEQLFIDLEQHAFNVFHVENAQGSPVIPAQEQFVRPYGIKSVLGFGGLLPTGELFAVIMFARVTIPRETADMFRTIALGVKLALLPFSRGPVFASQVSGWQAQDAAHARRPGEPLGATAEEQLRSEIGTLRLLIPALESAALHQTHRLKTAYSDLQMRGEQLLEQGMRLSAIFEGTTDGIFVLDRQWRFKFLNGRAESLIANGRNLLGQNIWELFPEAVGTAFWEQYQKVMREGVSVEFEEYYPAPLDMWFEVHAFPSAEGMTAFFHDITPRRKTEAALRRTEKLAVTGRLAASIAHEINNPLASVMNLLYLLAHDSNLDEADLGRVREAEQELQRISEISTHMLRFYRQSGSAVEVAVEEVLDSVLVLFKGKLAHAGIAVEKRYRPTRGLKAFSGELRQVFANLVGNALDAARQDGRIALRVRESRDLRTGSAGVRVTVADNGSGIGRGALAQIFEPFFTTKGNTGTGLGLWVSLELVQKHGGRISVRSATGEARHGTVFAVFFPFPAKSALGELSA